MLMLFVCVFVDVCVGVEMLKDDVYVLVVV